MVGVLRLNSQAMKIDSPLPDAVMALADMPEEELDEMLAVLQPVMEARKEAMRSYKENLAKELGVTEESEPDPELELEQEQEEGEDESEEEEEDDEEEELPELEEMFPPKRALGLFLLESSANHSCSPNAEILPLTNFSEGDAVDVTDAVVCGAGIAMVATRDIAAGEEVTVRLQLIG